MKLIRKLVRVKDNYVYSHINCSCALYCKNCDKEYPYECPSECLEEYKRIEQECTGIPTSGDCTVVYKYYSEDGEALFEEEQVEWVDYGNGYGRFSMVKLISPKMTSKTRRTSDGFPCWVYTDYYYDGQLIATEQRYESGRRAETWTLKFADNVTVIDGE